MLDELFAHLREAGVECEQVRAADRDIKPGVTSDEGEGDDWPALREQVLAADIFVLGTPIWLGHPSSFAQRVLERLDALLSETDDGGRMVSFGRVGAVVVCGNEDGAHHVSAELFQALSDVGFTIPPGAVAYWVGEAMGSVDYKDLPEPPEKTAYTLAALARNTVHLARVLAESPYPDQPGS
jgi:multimeric flavodoxin WrbA